MTIKFISLVTAIVLLDVSLQSQLSPSGPLSSFASSNLAVNTFLILMVGLMVDLSFRSKFNNWRSFFSCALLGPVLLIIGALGSFFSNTVYWFPSFLLPLDYLFILQAGAIFSLCALSYKHQKLPFRIRLPRPVLQIPRLAFLAPKLSHPSTSSRARRTQPA